MNNQEVFDKVVTHLRTQNRPSFEDHEGCMYRGPGGTMCAVGCLIPDNVYDAAMEREGVQAKVVSQVLKTLGFTGPQINLLGVLQKEHDAWATKGDGTWGADQEEAFANVAKNYELTMTEIAA